MPHAARRVTTWFIRAAQDTAGRILQLYMGGRETAGYARPLQTAPDGGPVALWPCQAPLPAESVPGSAGDIVRSDDGSCCQGWTRTRVVMAQVAGDPSARVSCILSALTLHLHRYL